MKKAIKILEERLKTIDEKERFSNIELIRGVEEWEKTREALTELYAKQKELEEMRKIAAFKFQTSTEKLIKMYNGVLR